MNSDMIRQCILEQVQQRGLEKSICPSAVARSLGGADWRSLMPCVRAIGAELAQSGEIRVLQKGKPVDPRTATRPIRFQQSAQIAERQIAEGWTAEKNPPIEVEGGDRGDKI
ncbi:MAG: hypothetical protein Fur0046_04400 [Cyanobacteria bacterium J069]|nr:MAG: DUF3253 domain-containing protein [Cyanobacteria bacterium J069]